MNELMNVSDFVVMMVLVGLLVALFAFIVTGRKGSRVPRSNACGTHTFRQSGGSQNVSNHMSADEAKDYWSNKQTHYSNKWDKGGYEANDKF